MQSERKNCSVSFLPHKLNASGQPICINSTVSIVILHIYALDGYATMHMRLVDTGNDIFAFQVDEVLIKFNLDVYGTWSKTIPWHYSKLYYF